MVQFHSIKVADVYKDTKDTTVVTFDIPEHLKSDFKFTQGQHLTLRKEINGQDVRRSYSLCSSPLDNQWRVAIKQIPGGIFSSYANTTLKSGDELLVMPPSGKFSVDLAPNLAKNYIAFAAGSGITPMLSIIKTHLLAEPNATFKLFYLNRTVKSIIFKEEIEQLKNIFFDRFEIFYFLTKEQRDIPLFNGRFTEEKIKTLSKHFFDVNDVDHCFICGPKDMIFMISETLQAMGLCKDNIHFELFFAGDVPVVKTATKEVSTIKANGIPVTIIDGGKEFHFNMESDYDNILDAALAAGADLPYACKGGVCSTCKCKLVEGEVKMKVNYALEDDEVANNYVLSCQAEPVSEKVVVDFDV
ncbi:phenylacetate-CoA oxygenase/reductase subunit PaaK [Paucihalobacter ruber]|uniref:Phenylacetate-CoA oxygenase/reductase subunit PaaK n=1 Tax=Paucihalobacter ruber TaxID=2567861 RepID=A0A506PG63_9FLAO|nr:1,2-phenylacetyl-CoA epoxidase subunit PaaE [Paucihalobacter ruber]TPV32037.1 phenylacetate-CoA oxygenase/reductase subunit PaaK [Paucihalobacter ruber]